MSERTLTPNPIATTLEHAYGSGSGRTLLIALAVGFTSSMIAVQTAVTRAIRMTSSVQISRRSSACWTARWAPSR